MLKFLREKKMTANDDVDDDDVNDDDDDVKRLKNDKTNGGKKNVKKMTTTLVDDDDDDDDGENMKINVKGQNDKIKFISKSFNDLNNDNDNKGLTSKSGKQNVVFLSIAVN